MQRLTLVNFNFILLHYYIIRKNIADFTSITIGMQTTNFIFPTKTDKFQKIIEAGDAVSKRNKIPDFYFKAYINIAIKFIKPDGKLQLTML
jgi:hypothetical protein